MSGVRKLVLAGFVAALPICVFAAGYYAYAWGAPVVQRILWAPVVATNTALESLCTRPGSGSFLCPADQGGYDQLFYAGFFLFYVFIGAAAICVVALVRRKA